MKYGVTDPDVLTGMILGVEGIPDIMVIFNGPTGCKFYHGHVAHQKRNDSGLSDPYLRPEPWFFGQARVPCTYLDDQDYIFGTAEKLEKILDYVGKKWNGLIVLINSPGAALIGDNLQKIIQDADMTDRCIPVEIPGHTLPSSAGVDTIIARILKHANPQRQAGSKVNLLGLSILQRHWEGTKKELTSLLERSGISVLATPGAGADTNALRTSANGALNIMVFPEYAQETASWYEKNYSIPCYTSADGAPIGFDATLSWISGICSILGVEPFLAVQEIYAARKVAATHIARLNTISGLPRGAGFAIRGDSSIALPLTKWLYTYLGMIPVGIEVIKGSYEPYNIEIQTFLNEIGLPDCWDIFPGTQNPDIIFTDGATGQMLTSAGICNGYIEIHHPSSGKIEILPRTICGITGSLYLIEEILNILR